jgi:hypothetical protein
MVLTTVALCISKRGRKTAAVLLNLLLIFAIYAIYTSLFYARKTSNGSYTRYRKLITTLNHAERLTAVSVMRLVWKA